MSETKDYPLIQSSVDSCCNRFAHFQDFLVERYRLFAERFCRQN